MIAMMEMADEKIEMELDKLSRAASRLRQLAEATAEAGLLGDHITCRRMFREPERLDIEVNWKRLERIR